MHHEGTHHIIQAIVEQLAIGNQKSAARIKRLLVVKQNRAITRRFWQLVDD